MSMLRQIWQALAQEGSRLFHLETQLSHCSVEPIYLSQGSVMMEQVQPGRPIVLTTLRGTVRVKRTDKNTFNMVAVPGQPVILYVPGQYAIRARSEVFGLRGERCPTQL